MLSESELLTGLPEDSRQIGLVIPYLNRGLERKKRGLQMDTDKDLAREFSSVS